MTRPYQSLVFRILKGLQVCSLLATALPFVLILFGNQILKETPVSKFDAVFLQHGSSLTLLEKITYGTTILSSFMFNVPYLAQICMEMVA